VRSVREAWAAFRADVAAIAGPGGTVRRVVLALLLPQVRAVAAYRAGHALAARGRVGLVAAYWLRARAVARTGAEIHPHAVFGPGLNLVHPVGVVIGGGVRAGAGCWIYQGVTLGHGTRPGQPVLGDGVHVGAGAKVLGGVHVGNGAVIGAGAVVVTDVPAGASARGVPAVAHPR
jgi:serine O-acetyltransferase